MPNPKDVRTKINAVLRKDDFGTNSLAQFKKDTNWTPSGSLAIFSVGQQPIVRRSKG
jgi:hypothetical protein